MITNKKYLILLFLLGVSNFCYAQKDKTAITNNAELKWFVSTGIGFQMSGIKNEDFVKSNYSPLLSITVGKWYTPLLAMQIGFKGFYFNMINNDKKHHYSFFYAEAVLNVNCLMRYYNNSSIWSLYLHSGLGFFYNYDYSKPNICANLGIQNNFRLTKQLQAFFNISAIVGWDIYQGDEDILPGILIGLTYQF